MGFVSLTTDVRSGVESFVDQFAIPWPNGYGAPLETIARFGAYSTERMSDYFNPGYELSPTLYLIGPDGRIVWHDGQARPLHTLEPAELVEELDAAIARALATDVPSK